jgi:Protein ChrB, N-terminal
MTQWLLLHYKLPSEPTALRVSIWRKLKRLGAILYQDTVWVLPSNARTLEQFQWLAAEIMEMGGESALWESHPLLIGKDDSLIAQFKEQADEGYRALLAQVELPEAELDTLARQYQQILLKDYFRSELGQQVRQSLLARRGVEV